MSLIAVVGKAGSGKNAVAEILRDRYGYHVAAFADPLREMALAVDPIVDWEDRDNSCGDQDCCGGPNIQPVRYSEAIAYLGYEKAKEEYPEVRRFLQTLGFEGVRGHLGDSAWIDAWEVRVAGKDNVVVPDARFQNEAAAVRSLGGSVWRIVRDGAGLADEAGQHASETELDSIASDVILHNHRDLDYLGQLVERALTRDA